MGESVNSDELEWLEYEKARAAHERNPSLASNAAQAVAARNPHRHSADRAQ
jgi:hypothetical protein